jgi:mRNA interferase MazF
MKKQIIPDRGDIVWVNLDPVLGHEQGGHRPALVISPYDNNKITSMAIICPITSKVKNYIFEVQFKSENLSGSVLVDQIRSIDISRREIEIVEKIDEFTFTQVIGKMLTLIQ